MRFIRRLLAVELVAQIALAICALSFALVFVVGGALVTGQNAQDLGVATSALLALAFAVYCTGAVAVIFLGAPLYAILEAKSLATTATSALVGIVPGAILLIVSIASSASLAKITPAYAVIYLACGIPVAWTTHLFRTWNQGEGRAA